jgi:hypothetical protein
MARFESCHHVQKPLVGDAPADNLGPGEGGRFALRLHREDTL